LFCLNVCSYSWQVFEHLGEAGFNSFYHKLPTISAIYFTQQYTNDVDKGLQGYASLAGFLVTIIGGRKEAIDMINDLITQNEGLFVSAGGHATAPRTMLSRITNVQYDGFLDRSFL